VTLELLLFIFERFIKNPPAFEAPMKYYEHRLTALELEEEERRQKKIARGMSYSSQREIPPKYEPAQIKPFVDNPDEPDNLFIITSGYNKR